MCTLTTHHGMEKQWFVIIQPKIILPVRNRNHVINIGIRTLVLIANVVHGRGAAHGRVAGAGGARWDDAWFELVSVGVGSVGVVGEA